MCFAGLLGCSQYYLMLLFDQMRVEVTHFLLGEGMSSTVLASPAAVAVAQSSTCVETLRSGILPRAC